MTEEWRDIPGFYGYQVSSHGRVMSFHKHGPGWELKGEGRLLAGFVDKDGYKKIGLQCAPGKSKCIGAHRLVAEAFLPDTKFEGALVLHKDGNPSNNHVSNLRWGTALENTSDRGLHGTLGITRSVEEIAEIKRLYAMGFQQREIARVFQTTQTYVHMLVTGKQRKDVA